MTILDRLLAHDAWTTRQLLLRCRELTDEQMDRSFDIGGRSLRATFAHLVGCMEMHTDLLTGGQREDQARTDETVDGLIHRLSTIAKTFAAAASKVEREGTADEICPAGKLPNGSVVAHLLTHSMHHRGQAMYLLEQFGIADVIEGDALGWEGQARGWGYDWCNSYGRVVAG